MKKFTLVLFVLCSLRIYSQTNAFDSLNIVLKKSKHDTSKVQAMYELAKLYLQNNADTAYLYSKKAFDLSEKIKYKKGIGDGYSFYAYQYFSENKIDKSIEYFEKSIGIKTQLNDKKGASIAYYNLASVCAAAGRKDKTLESFNKSIGIKKEIGDVEGISLMYNEMASYFLTQSNLQDAKKYCLKSDSTMRTLHKNDLTADNLLYIGNVYQKKGGFKIAMEYYQQALELVKGSDNKKLLVKTYSSLANCYLSLGDAGNSLKYHLKALDVAETLMLKELAIQAYYGAGNASLMLGNMPKALEYYSKELKLTEQERDYREMGLCLNSMANVYRNLGDLDRAIEYLMRANKLIEGTNDKSEIATLNNNIGLLLLEKGDYTQSMAYLTKGLKAMKELNNKQGISSCVSNIALIHQRQNRLDSALYYLDISKKIKEETGDKAGLANVLNNNALIHLKLKQFDKCRTNNSTALQINREIKSPDQIRKALRTLSQLEYKTNNLTAAETAHDEILDLCNKTLKINFPTMSEKEKENLFKIIGTDFDNFNSFCLVRKAEKPQITERVYNHTIRNKGLLLRSSTAMRHAILGSKDTSIIKKYDEWISIKKKIAQLYNKGKDTKELEEAANNIEKDLVKGSSAFNSLDKLQKVNWKDVQAALKPNEAAIEFINFSHEEIKDSANSKMIYCALIIKQGSKQPEMIKLFEEKELINVLGKKAETGENYITNIYGEQNKENPNIYNLVWKPMEPFLNGIKTIYYSPSGLLHKISFAALNKSKNSYLCDKYRLELEGSTSRLAMKDNESKIEKPSMYVFGDIQYDTPTSIHDTTALLSWPYLEGTKTESEKILSVLKGSDFEVNYLKGNDAKESEFKSKAPSANIVHVATHGFFFPDPSDYYESSSDEGETRGKRGGQNAIGITNFIVNKNPLMRSGLVFAGANDVWVREEYNDGEDGVLTAQEVAILDLRKTKLIILSACETGLGDIKGVEGVYGLQRSLKMAGVEYIVMSLWQVPDAETAEFMEKFYTRLVKTKNLKDSFYATRNEMRKKYDPFYWAAFVLLE
jgi:CHAT domain-containing protein